MIGPGWGPVLINSEEEYNITRGLHLCSRGIQPLVGGTINLIVVDYYKEPELYFPNNSGKCKSNIRSTMSNVCIT